MKDLIQLTLSSNDAPVLVNTDKIQCIYSHMNKDELVTKLIFDDGDYLLVKESIFKMKSMLNDCAEDTTEFFHYVVNDSLMNLMKDIKKTCEERKNCNGCKFYNVDIADCVFRESPERWYL